MATKCLKLEVVHWDDPEHRQIAYDVSDAMRRVVNFTWRQWEAWHTGNESAAKVKLAIEAHRAWKLSDKKTRGPQAKWTVQPWPNDFGKLMYRKLVTEFPELHTRVLTLFLQKLRSTICTKQSTAAAVKWWVAILLDLDSRGRSKFRQPIPFDSSNSEVYESTTKGRVGIRLRIDRVVGKEGQRGKSTVIDLQLKTDGRAWRYAEPARKIVSGEAPLRGCQLLWDEGQRKWFVAVVYDVESIPTAVDPDRKAVVIPGRRHGWLVRIGGYTRWMGGDGREVAFKRQSLTFQRKGRQASYRQAPPRKGHGRDRVLAPMFVLQTAWNDFTRRKNDAMANVILSYCVTLGCGTITLRRGDDRRLLAMAGKTSSQESSGWAWYQFEQLLQQKSQRLGVKVIPRTNSKSAVSTQAVVA